MDLLDGSIVDAVELLQGGMDSHLGDSPLSDILMWLFHARRDAVVVIGDEPYTATLELSRGQLVRAACGPLRGPAAVAALLSLSEGRVRLIMGTVTALPRELDGSTPEVLLACAGGRGPARSAA